MENIPKWTTIRISQDTRTHLDSLGKKGETYDNILSRILASEKPRLKW